MISKKMQDALNDQVAAEFYSAYLYLSMSAYLESINLPGFANWMRVQYGVNWSRRGEAAPLSPPHNQ
jgi:ferritin